MSSLLALSLVLCAGKGDAKLVGTWSLANEPFITMNANGSGSMDGDAVTWATEGATLVIKDSDGGEDRVGYQLAGDALTLTINGVPMQLTRGGKAAPKKGKLTQKAEARAAGSEADEEAQAMAMAQAWLAQQQGGQAALPGGPQGRQAAPMQAPSPGGVRAGPAGADQLSRLLMSSNWCWLRYSNGNSYTQKVRFNGDGTWTDFSESDIYVNNSNGYAQSTGNNQAGGQWAVKGGQLYLSKPPETPQLTPMPLSITQNSNGAPIITADGREYSRCN